MQSRPVTLMARLLKIIFVHVRIFTGIISEVPTVTNFSQPKEAQKPHTGIIPFASFTIYIETSCKYF